MCFWNKAMEMMLSRKQEIDQKYGVQLRKNGLTSLVSVALLGAVAFFAGRYNYNRVAYLYETPGVKEAFNAESALQALIIAQPVISKEINSETLKRLETRVKQLTTTPEYQAFREARDSINSTNYNILFGFLAGGYLIMRNTNKKALKILKEREEELKEE